jgi:hypothetical protein
METNESQSPHDHPGAGPKFLIDIEGATYPWTQSTITVPELRELGGLPSDVPVEEINLDTNEQKTLAEDATVELKPGVGFSKKIKFRRG